MYFIFIKKMHSDYKIRNFRISKAFSILESEFKFCTEFVYKTEKNDRRFKLVAIYKWFAKCSQIL